MNQIIKTKIRTRLKALAKSSKKCSADQAYLIIYKQIKSEEHLLDEEMNEIGRDIEKRLQENWASK